MAKAADDLKAAGFTQHENTPNLWVKDGVAISHEQVKKVGITKAIRVHAMHVEGIQLAKQSQA